MKDIIKYVYTMPFIGQFLPDYVGFPDSTQFDIDDSGGNLRIVINKPTEEELHEFKHADIEVRMTPVINAIWLTFKFGNLDWTEAPYTPHLSHRLHLIDDAAAFRKLCGRITVGIIDSSDGIIKHLVDLELSKEFADAFFELANKLYFEYPDFDKKRYFLMLDAVQNNLSAAEIAYIPRTIVCRIKGLAE